MVPKARLHRCRAHKDIVHEKCDPTSSPHRFADFVPLVSAPAHFPVEVFIAVLDGIVAHPEHGSSNILRAERLEDLSLGDDEHRFDGLQLSRRFKRRLKPSRPFDAELDQICSFYRGSDEALVLLEPIIGHEETFTMPFYHPDVSGIALRYLPEGILRIEVRPRWDQKVSGYEESSRVYRTALSLLTSIRKRGEGTYLRAYQKRVHHDRLVLRDRVQDKRLELKPKYAWAMTEWMEKTRPEKHVFEDIAIAAYLVVLWEQMYPDNHGRPPFFVDLGAGNGFLTYILAQEGYRGLGIDLRSRKSWSLWRERAEQPLMLTAQGLDLPGLVLDATLDAQPDFARAFLIGNHADELTPWIPLIATAHSASGFINLACCLHDLAGPFTTTSHKLPTTLWPSSQDEEAFLGATSETGGRYAAYQLRIAQLTLESGWLAEREMLRISSTRNAAIVGRQRIKTRDEVMPRLLEMAEMARIGGWSMRPREGKDHGP